MIPDQVSEATPVAHDRARRRNPLTRLSAAHLLMVLAAVLAFATNLMVLRNHDQTRPVAVAAVDLPAGEPIESAYLRSVEVDVDDATYVMLVPWAQVPSMLGRVPVYPIQAGSLLSLSDLRDPAGPSGLRSMSIPIEAEHAVGGSISPGDRVDLIWVAGDDASYVLTNAEVLAVSTIGDLGALATGDFYFVIAVDADQALAVATALSDGQIEVVRSTGASAMPAGMSG